MELLKTIQVEDSPQRSAKDEQEFRKLLPATGFLGDYMRYTDRQESPGSYHFWVAATIVSAVLQRNCWISRGIYNAYPNLYTVLVGPTGRCRKSRAISIGSSLVEEFDWLNIIADKTTPEALLQSLMVGTQQVASTQPGMGGTPQSITLQLDHVGLVKSTEFSVFLNKALYSTGMVAVLTDLYDCPKKFKYITRNKSPVLLDNPGLQLLAATTPDWLATSIPPAAFEGGFMGRILFIVKHWRDRLIAWPQAPDPQEFVNLKSQLLKMRALFNGKIDVTTEGRDWFDKWYMTVSQQDPTAPHLLGFLEKKPEIILKVSLILAASELKKLITKPHLQVAKAIVEWSQLRMFRAFEYVDLTPQGQLQRKILEYLDAQQGWVTRRDILRKYGGRLPFGVRSLDDMMKVLILAEQVEEKTTVNKQGPATVEYVSL